MNIFFFFCLFWDAVSPQSLISRGKPTQYSSTWAGLYGSLAVDGRYEPFINQDGVLDIRNCFVSNNDANPFLLVDLQGAFSIDYVVIYTRTECCTDRIVGSVVELLSQSDQVTSECGKITQSQSTYKISCGNVTAQKIRVKGQPDQFLQICQLDVYGDPITSLISRGKSTFHSSFFADMDSSLAVDGRYDNYVNKDDVYDLWNCFVSEQEDMPFFVIDLQGTYRIEYIVLYNREDCCSDRMIGAVVELLFKDDNINHECTKITESQFIYNISCGNNLAEKIRVVGPLNEYLQLCEVDVYGKMEQVQSIISRGKPTTQSSTYANLDGSLAVNGFYENFVDFGEVLNVRNCFVSNDDEIPFLKIDLQAKFVIKTVVLYNRMDCCSKRIIGSQVELLSRAGEVLHVCGKISTIMSTYNISCDNKVAELVQIRGAPNEFLQICEVDVHGESTVSIISKGKPTSSSSVYDGLDGSFAVDGVYNYNFSHENDVNLFHTNDDKDPFWEVDLKGKFNIDKVVIYNRIDCCSDRMVNGTVLLVTDTGEVSYQCGQITDTKTVYQIPCGNNVAHKVRIKGPANEYLHVIEVDVFGEPTA